MVAAVGCGPESASDEVFISHKSEYKPWVEWLARALQDQGRRVFLDMWNLVPGDNWVEGLHRGLERCRSAVLVATPEVVNSGWVREEYAAMERRRVTTSDFRLVPIVFGAFPNLPFLGNIQSVDCRDPARYLDWFWKILCGIEGREPGSCPQLFRQPPPPPPLKAPCAGEVVPSEQRFVQKIMLKAGRPDSPPTIVASRGHRHQGPVIQALRAQAESVFGTDCVIHASPPFSPQATVKEFFIELSRQCGLDPQAADSTAFVSQLEQRTDKLGRAFLLVTGFENAAETCRRELAGALRVLTERRPSLRVVLVGGYRLVEQKYATGNLSFLSHASVEEWPQPAIGDLLTWQRLEFPSKSLSEEEARRILEVSGGHNGLARHCLERWDAYEDTRWQEWCQACPELVETWYRLRCALDVSRVREMLERDSFGPAIAWPADSVARSFYWNDLLKISGAKLVWRAEVVRQVGRVVVQ